MFPASLLLLLAVISCVHCGLELTQPSILNIKPGESLVIDCPAKHAPPSKGYTEATTMYRAAMELGRLKPAWRGSPRRSPLSVGWGPEELAHGR
ncbi:hypothetical protein UPYG_G00104630 [Umbra pygmaea]|uniref:Uncharacterized protein n=1 Tax=Umbra pygmaea TaxID=75934 RepID=A0ABD0XP59_UMBPY